MRTKIKNSLREPNWTEYSEFKMHVAYTSLKQGAYILADLWFFISNRDKF